MTQTWHQIASDLLPAIKGWGFETKTEKCGELAGRAYFNSYVKATDDEFVSIFDDLTLNCE